MSSGLSMTYLPLRFACRENQCKMASLSDFQTLLFTDLLIIQKRTVLSIQNYHLLNDKYSLKLFSIHDYVYVSFLGQSSLANFNIFISRLRNLWWSLGKVTNGNQFQDFEMNYAFWRLEHCMGQIKALQRQNISSKSCFLKRHLLVYLDLSVHTTNSQGSRPELLQNNMFWVHGDMVP